MIATLIQNLSRSSFKSSSLPKSILCFSLVPLSTSCESQFLKNTSSGVYESPPNSESQSPSDSTSPLSFLKQNGFSDSQLEKAVKCWPRLPSVDVEKVIKPRLEIFRQFGLSAPDIAEIVSNNSWVLHMSSSKRIIPCLSILKGMLGVDELPKYLKRSGWFFRANLENCLVPNVDFFTNCGVSKDQILKHLYYFPRFLLSNPERIKKFVDRADAMGVRRPPKKFILAVRVLSSMSDDTWELKLQSFRDLGFSDDDIVTAFVKSPRVFAYSLRTLNSRLMTLRQVGFSDDDIASTFRKHPAVFDVSNKKIRNSVGAILASGKYTVSSIVSIPGSLSFSLEKRYKPRFQVLELLEGKNLIQNWPLLSTLCCMTDEKFHERYIAPFLDEIGDANLVERWRGQGHATV